MVCRTNSLPMKPAPPATRSLIGLHRQGASDVLDPPIEADARIVPRNASLIGNGGGIRRGDVVHQVHIRETQALIPMSDKRRDRNHSWTVLAENECLNGARGGGVRSQVHQHHAGVADHDIPVVPLLPVPVKGLDQLWRVAASRIDEAARHLCEGPIGDERPALVVDVAALELLDEEAALIRMLPEGLDLHVMDAPNALRRRNGLHAREGRLDLRCGGHPRHQRNSTRLWSPTISLIVRGRSGERPILHSLPISDDSILPSTSSMTLFSKMMLCSTSALRMAQP